jgi:hypothetical protein
MVLGRDSKVAAALIAAMMAMIPWLRVVGAGLLMCFLLFEG